MANAFSSFTLAQLQAALDLKRQMAALEEQLDRLVAPSRRRLAAAPANGRRGRRKISAEGRRRIAEAQRARRKREQSLIRSGRNPRKKLNRAARAKLSAAARLRWARTKAAGRTHL